MKNTFTLTKTANGFDIKTSGGGVTLNGNPLASYPINSLYISTDEISPASLFGGTWEKIKDKFLLAAGDSFSLGATGGNSVHSHTLNNAFAKIFAYWGEDANRMSWENKNVNWIATQTLTHGHTISYNQSISMGNAVPLGGNTDDINNMPPYLVVNVWKRKE